MKREEWRASSSCLLLAFGTEVQRPRGAETEVPSVWGTMRMMVVTAVPPVREWTCRGPSVYTGEDGQCPHRGAATRKPAGCPGRWLWDAFSQCRSGGRSVSRELSPKAECRSDCWCPCPVLGGTEEQEGRQPTTTIAPRALGASGGNEQKPSDADRVNRGKPRCWTAVCGGGGSVCFPLVPTCVLWAPRQEEKASFCVPSGEAAMGQALSWTMVTAGRDGARLRVKTSCPRWTPVLPSGNSANHMRPCVTFQ